MKIYMAGFFDTRARLRPIRDRLRAQGAVVLSSWLDEEGVTYQTVDDAYKTSCALRDLEEVQACDILILDTLDESSRGGREVEYGYALGKMKQVWVVGPLRNVFHYVAAKHFSSWDEVMAWLASG